MVEDGLEEGLEDSLEYGNEGCLEDGLNFRGWHSPDNVLCLISSAQGALDTL